jgi:hypothetical protein
MDSATSVNGVPIRLTDERWEHIIRNRDNLIGLEAEVLRAVTEPDLVVEGDEGALMAVRSGILDKSLIVVYREVSREDGFIITAWLTSRPQRVVRRPAKWTRER